jgi:hypothetical protein
MPSAVKTFPRSSAKRFRRRNGAVSARSRPVRFHVQLFDGSSGLFSFGFTVERTTMNLFSRSNQMGIRPFFSPAFLVLLFWLVDSQIPNGESGAVSPKAFPSALLLRDFEPQVGSGADPHQGQQSSTELWHR